MVFWYLKKVYYRFIQLIVRNLTHVLRFKNPELITGPGSILQLEKIMLKKRVKKVLFVASKRVMDSVIIRELLEKLKEQNIDFVSFSDVTPNPTIKNIEDGLQIYEANNCDCVAAIGGGSQIDCAKLIAARASNKNLQVRQLRGLLKVRCPLPPLFVAPTTAGSGSETTIAAVVSDSETHEKYAVMDLKLVPTAALLDPKLTVSLPPNMTSTTGMDALTHAIEAYIGHNGTKYTNEKALSAIEMIFHNLETAYNHGTDIHARNEMLLASYYAGIAFTRAYVGYVHAISHTLGGLYNVPHGLANAIVLPYILEYYDKSIYKKLANISVEIEARDKNTSEEILAKNFIEKIKKMNEKMNIPNKIKEIKPADIPLIAKRALKEGNPSYPVPKIMSYEECVEILKKLTVAN